VVGPGIYALMGFTGYLFISSLITLGMFLSRVFGLSSISPDTTPCQIRFFPL
jgi:hypothetical protein